MNQYNASKYLEAMNKNSPSVLKDLTTVPPFCMVYLNVYCSGRSLSTQFLDKIEKSVTNAVPLTGETTTMPD